MVYLDNSIPIFVNLGDRDHKALGNLVRYYNMQETYVDDAESWMGILAAAAFAVQSTYHWNK